MKAAIKIELIGDGDNQRHRFYSNMVDDVIGIKGLGAGIFGRAPSEGWVAEILGKHKSYKYSRRFLRKKKDYAKSNSNGSRGVHAWYLLESERYYEVYERVSWRKFDRYFVKVNDSGDIQRIGEEDVQEWVKNQ